MTLTELLFSDGLLKTKRGKECPAEFKGAYVIEHNSEERPTATELMHMNDPLQNIDAYLWIGKPKYHKLGFRGNPGWYEHNIVFLKLLQ